MVFGCIDDERMAKFMLCNASIISMVLDRTSEKKQNDAPQHKRINKNDKLDKIDVPSINNSRGGVGGGKSIPRSPTIGGEKLRQRKSSQMRSRKSTGMAPNAYGGGGGGTLVSLHPSNEILFYSSAECEVLQTLTMTNNTVTDTVAYKIKSTSPENFRVRPSTGAIPAGDSIEVQIYLQPGHEITSSKDKFLIQSALVPDQENYDFSSLWSSISRSNILEQRLKCRYLEHSEPRISPSVSSSEGRKSEQPPDPYLTVIYQFQNVNAKLDSVKDKVLILDNDVQNLFRILTVFLLALFVTFVSLGLYMWRDFFIE